ncbi:hypothetical protein BOSEA31B_11467 [Hyphomicrobiales bacterium]|nr:hypothetical protein BOSEA31B_11467 [Hyphomicrobiales bacterium]CAH1697262.1 hypothetical protein BOSEA1005_10299 [Hyphomicrobiales bacterium]CAI0342830.1 hypothetical protein BO1005MUT1_10123 [Hyphomicrobiales bacterium]
MRPERNQQPRQQGNPYARHSGGFAESADNPRDSTACGVPEDTRNGQKRREGVAVISFTGSLREEEPAKTDKSRNQQERHSANKSKPMKAARHPVHGGMLQFATATCLFARPLARGDALLALASFAMVAWVMMRGLA